MYLNSTEYDKNSFEALSSYQRFNIYKLLLVPIQNSKSLLKIKFCAAGAKGPSLLSVRRAQDVPIRLLSGR